MSHSRVASFEVLGMSWKLRYLFPISFEILCSERHLYQITWASILRIEDTLESCWIIRPCTRALTADVRRDTRRFLCLPSKTPALEGLGRHSQRHLPQSEEVAVFTREVQRLGRKEAWKGPMTSLVVIRVKWYEPANESFHPLLGVSWVKRLHMGGLPSNILLRVTSWTAC